MAWICNIPPSDAYYGQTKATIDFASRLFNIRQCAKKNIIKVEESMMEKIKFQIISLKH